MLTFRRVFGLTKFKLISFFFTKAYSNFYLLQNSLIFLGHFETIFFKKVTLKKRAKRKYKVKSSLGKLQFIRNPLISFFLPPKPNPLVFTNNSSSYKNLNSPRHLLPVATLRVVRRSLKTAYTGGLRTRPKLSSAFKFSVYSYTSNNAGPCVPLPTALSRSTNSYQLVSRSVRWSYKDIERLVTNSYSFSTVWARFNVAKTNLSQLAKISYKSNKEITTKRRWQYKKPLKSQLTRHVRPKKVRFMSSTTSLTTFLNLKSKVKVRTRHTLLRCFFHLKRRKVFHSHTNLNVRRFYTSDWKKLKRFPKPSVSPRKINTYLTTIGWKPVSFEGENVFLHSNAKDTYLRPSSNSRLKYLQRHVMQKFQVFPTHTIYVFGLNVYRNIVHRRRVINSVRPTTGSLFSTQISCRLHQLLSPLTIAPTPWKSLKTTHIFSYHGLPFISYSADFKTYNRFMYKTNVTFAYKIWKSFYSFLKTNELKKYTYDSVRVLLFKQLQKHLMYSHRLFRNVVTKHSSFSFFSSLYMLDESDKSSTFFTDQIYWRHNEIAPAINFPFPKSGTKTELHIPRVKFKPGYMRLWRHFRLAFAESVNFKYIYQQQLTRYISRFSRKTQQSYFQFFENKITAMFIYSRLVPDEPTFNTFMANKLLYLNHTVITDKSLYIYPTDFLQVIVSNWYYIFLRWLLSCLKLRYKKFGKLVFRKSATTRYKSIKRTKQKSFYTPNWIYLVKYDYTIIKSFFEVDFFTLSCYCLYNPFQFSHYSPKDFKVLRAPIVRLYNWKYIN